MREDAVVPLDLVVVWLYVVVMKKGQTAPHPLSIDFIFLDFLVLVNYNRKVSVPIIL